MMVGFGSAPVRPIMPRIFNINKPFYYAIKTKDNLKFFEGDIQTRFLSK